PAGETAAAEAATPTPGRRFSAFGPAAAQAGGTAELEATTAVLGVGPLVLSGTSIPVSNYEGGARFTVNYLALLLALVIYTSAFIGEIVRGGIQAVHRGQREAAMALGLSGYQTFSLVVFPQALRIILPPVISQYLNLTKNSSLAVLAGYAELFVIASVISNQTGAAIPIALILIGSYLAISLAFSIVLNNVNARLALVERCPVPSDRAQAGARPHARTRRVAEEEPVLLALQQRPHRRHRSARRVLALQPGALRPRRRLVGPGVGEHEALRRLPLPRRPAVAPAVRSRRPDAAARGDGGGRRARVDHRQRLLRLPGLRRRPVSGGGAVLAVGAPAVAAGPRRRVRRLPARARLAARREGAAVGLGPLVRARPDAALRRHAGLGA